MRYLILTIFLVSALFGQGWRSAPFWGWDSNGDILISGIDSVVVSQRTLGDTIYLTWDTLGGLLYIDLEGDFADSFCGYQVFYDTSTVDFATPGYYIPHVVDTNSLDSLLVLIDSLIMYFDTLLIRTDTLLTREDTLLARTDTLLTRTDSLIMYSETLIVWIDTLLDRSDTILIRTDTLLTRTDSLIMYSETLIVWIDTLLDRTYTLLIRTDSLMMYIDTLLLSSDSTINLIQDINLAYSDSTINLIQDINSAYFGHLIIDPINAIMRYISYDYSDTLATFRLYDQYGHENGTRVYRRIKE